MFALEAFALLVGLAVLIAMVRRRGETKTNCGLLGASSRPSQSSRKGSHSISAAKELK
jgi:hypothetical protein